MQSALRIASAQSRADRSVQARSDAMRVWVGLMQAVLLACAATAHAQQTTGTISGRIVDAQGLVVPGVTVTVKGEQGTKTAVTDADGRFSVPFLTPGAYAIHAELQGFKAVDRGGLEVHLGQTVDVPVTLEVGAVTESVDVTASSPTLAATGTT